MAKYKVGDKVWVREDLKENERYVMEHDSDIDDSAVSEMVKFRGEKMKIAEVTSAQKYRLRDSDTWNWTDGMFAGKAYEKGDIEVGDRVRFREDLTYGRSYGGLTWFGVEDYKTSRTFTVTRIDDDDFNVAGEPYWFNVKTVAEVIKKEDVKMKTSQKETTKTPSKKRDFKVGDIVVIRDWDDMKSEFGCTSNGHIPCANSFVRDMKYLCGTRCRISKIENALKRVWLKSLSGESIERWAFSTDMIRHDDTIKTGKIVITSDGRVTKAQLFDGKKYIKETIATCSPSDEFDFMTGAQVAFERLMNTETKTAAKEPHWNAKVVCVSGKHKFTTGKVYEVNNGRIVADDGEVLDYVYSSLQNMNDRMASQFILLVE